jgi:hypothetical protein
MAQESVKPANILWPSGSRSDRQKILKVNSHSVADIGDEGDHAGFWFFMTNGSRPSVIGSSIAQHI